MDDLIARIRAAIDEDEQWALACNLPYQYADKGATAPAAGVHWRWGVGENWDTAVPDPVADEFVGGYDGGPRATLVTIEEWPCTSRGEGWEHTSMMPRSYGAAEEMDSAAGGHIIRHDPARVLRQAAAHRRILELHARRDTPLGPYCLGCGSRDNAGDPDSEWPCLTVVAVAEAYGIGA